MPITIYFSGSIRGGRELQPRYQAVIQALQAQGWKVHTEHVGQKDLKEKLLDDQIYRRDIQWIADSDFVIADVTVPSLGVGFEISEAVGRGLSTLCLAESGSNVSAMITGCPDLTIAFYDNTEEAVEIAVDWIKFTLKADDI